MATIKAGTLKRLHVNGALLRKHLKAAKPISIKNRGLTKRASVVSIDGPSQWVYSPQKPLSSGAVMWIETKAAVSYK